MKREPVVIIEAVKTFINLFVVWLVVMGYWPMSDMQQAATISMAMAGVNLGGAFLQRRLSTPVNQPRDREDYPLVRENWR